MGITPYPWYTVSAAAWKTGLLYSVSAVNAEGAETLPSAPARAQGGFDPTQAFPLLAVPGAPLFLEGFPEWNQGGPRLRLAWRAAPGASTYSVWKNGVRVVSGLWGLAYFDPCVPPGGSAQYTVRGVNPLGREGPASAPVTLQAPTGPPPALGVVTVTAVVPNDDSVSVHFAAVPGAADYRVRLVGGRSAKHSGGGLVVEWALADPVAGATVIVEALDKLGPFQKMDGDLGIGHAADPTCTCPALTCQCVEMVTNGQGDPSNAPAVLATSLPVAVSSAPVVLPGTQVFFDDFRDSTPLLPVPAPPELLHANLQQVWAVANAKWRIFNVQGDGRQTRAFVMNQHFMDTLYDGGTPGTNLPLHQANASLVMMPQATADLRDGGVLHVTFEVDAHFGNRRWCDLLLTAAGDPLRVPGKLVGNTLFPTDSGRSLRWQIQRDIHRFELFTAEKGPLQSTPVLDISYQPGNDRAAARRLDQNGSAEGGLDLRQRFDLYLSRERYRPVGAGRVVKERPLPVPLPFLQVQVYFVHQLYHTDTDRAELLKAGSADRYWYNYRPYADERHWDNMGFEVLTSFPA
jgi:hypothetical protein